MSNEWPKFVSAEEAMAATTNMPQGAPSSMPAIAAAMQKLTEQMNAIAESTTKEFAKWMQDQGFDPYDEKAPCYLILPVSYRDQLITVPPFVRFSPLIDAPTLMRDPFGTMSL